MDRPIGDVFEYDGTRFIVIPHDGCVGCFFRQQKFGQVLCNVKGARAVIGNCMQDLRSTKDSVQFIPVEDL